MNLENVPFVGLCCIIILQCTVQKTQNMLQNIWLHSIHAHTPLLQLQFMCV